MRKSLSLLPVLFLSALGDITKKNSFYISSALGYFYRVIEQEITTCDLNVGCMTWGLPYKSMQTRVDNTITLCNATVLKLSELLPSPAIKAAMTDSRIWGVTGANENSLELVFASEHRNSPFDLCFSNAITPWANQIKFEDELTTEILFYIGAVLIAAAIIATTCIICCCCTGTLLCELNKVLGKLDLNGKLTKTAHLLQKLGNLFYKEKQTHERLVDEAELENAIEGSIVPSNAGLTQT